MRGFGAVAVAAMSVLVISACAPSTRAVPGGSLGLRAPATASAGWGRAERVPGLAALAGDEDSGLSTVSCASPGNCSAGGFYEFGKRSCCRSEAFVVSQVNGKWGQAQEVPGIAALNVGDNARVTTVSCASPGNCSAGGSFGVPVGQGSFQSDGFVVSQVDGTWNTASAVRGTAGIGPVSCTSPGDCGAAGGELVVSQADGTWGTAQKVAVPAGSTFGQARISVISCSAAGSCTAGGGGNKMDRALVVSQVGGTWGTSREIPGTAALSKRGSSQVSSVSCTRPGDCTAGGFAPWQHPEGSSTRSYAVPYVVSQRHGTWGQAQRVPGIAAVSKFGFAEVTAVSCASPGNCGIAGRYSTSTYNPDGSGSGQVFVASQVKGALSAPRVITSGLRNDGPAEITAISCTAAGQCSAVGYYWRGTQERAFVISQAS